MVDSSSLAAEHLSPAEVELVWDGTSGSAHEQSLHPHGHGTVTKASSGRILIAEDDQPLSRFLDRTLRADSHVVEIAADGNTALQMIRPNIDLIILDLNLPGLDGLSVLRSMRPLYPTLPVLVLTARSRTEDMVLALETGADDCLTKPFSYLELLARVRALLRRNVPVAPDVSRVGDLVLHREEHRVERNGRRVELTPREFGLLEYLLRKPGVPASRATLMKEVWDMEFDPSTNVVDVYMKYVRDKVDLPGELKLIRTVRGIGYAVSDD